MRALHHAWQYHPAGEHQQTGTPADRNTARHPDRGCPAGLTGSAVNWVLPVMGVCQTAGLPGASGLHSTPQHTGTLVFSRQNESTSCQNHVSCNNSFKSSSFFFPKLSCLYLLRRRLHPQNLDTSFVYGSNVFTGLNLNKSHWEVSQSTPTTSPTTHSGDHRGKISASQWFPKSSSPPWCHCRTELPSPCSSLLASSQACSMCCCWQSPGLCHSQQDQRGTPRKSRHQCTFHQKRKM